MADEGSFEGGLSNPSGPKGPQQQGPEIGGNPLKDSGPRPERQNPLGDITSGGTQPNTPEPAPIGEDVAPKISQGDLQGALEDIADYNNPQITQKDKETTSQEKEETKIPDNAHQEVSSKNGTPENVNQQARGEGPTSQDTTSTTNSPEKPDPAPGEPSPTEMKVNELRARISQYPEVQAALDNLMQNLTPEALNDFVQKANAKGIPIEEYLHSITESFSQERQNDTDTNGNGKNPDTNAQTNAGEEGAPPAPVEQSQEQGQAQQQEQPVQITDPAIEAIANKFPDNKDFRKFLANHPELYDRLKKSEDFQNVLQERKFLRDVYDTLKDNKDVMKLWEKAVKNPTPDNIRELQVSSDSAKKEKDAKEEVTRLNQELAQALEEHSRNPSEETAKKIKDLREKIAEAHKNLQAEREKYKNPPPWILVLGIILIGLYVGATYAISSSLSKQK